MLSVNTTSFSLAFLRGQEQPHARAAAVLSVEWFTRGYPYMVASVTGLRGGRILVQLQQGPRDTYLQAFTRLSRAAILGMCLPQSSWLWPC